MPKMSFFKVPAELISHGHGERIVFLQLHGGHPFSILSKGFFSMGRKRKTKSGTDSSSASQECVRQDSKIQKTSVDDEMDLTAIIVKLDQLSTQTNAGFQQLHEDFDTFKQEIKADVKAIKTVIRDLENATEFISNDVENLKMMFDKEKTERTALMNRIDCLEKTGSKFNSGIETTKR